MMTVTDEARSHLANALESAAPEEETEDTCFRIVREENRLTMVLGRASESDAVVSHEGKPVLAMDEEVAPMLDGHTLDVERNDEGKAMLTIR